MCRTKGRCRKWRSKSRKASGRADGLAAASPWRGIYDVISSLTVNNFPRGCGRHRVFASRDGASVLPHTAPRQSTDVPLASAARDCFAIHLSPLPPFSSLCKLKRRRRERAGARSPRACRKVISRRRETRARKRSDWSRGRGANWVIRFEADSRLSHVERSVRLFFLSDVIG